MKPHRVIVNAIRADSRGCIGDRIGYPPGGWSVVGPSAQEQTMTNAQFVRLYEPADDEAREYLGRLS